MMTREQVLFSLRCVSLYDAPNIAEVLSKAATLVALCDEIESLNARERIGSMTKPETDDDP